jgi:hypothetical protein
LTISGDLDGFSGDYRIVNTSGKELDFGLVEAF